MKNTTPMMAEKRIATPFAKENLMKPIVQSNARKEPIPQKKREKAFSQSFSHLISQNLSKVRRGLGGI